MEGLFSRQWAERFAAQWNASMDMVAPLSAANFNSVIAFGFCDETNPAVLLEVKNGKVAKAGTYVGTGSPTPDWDLRASAENWANGKKKAWALPDWASRLRPGNLNSVPAITAR